MEPPPTSHEAATNLGSPSSSALAPQEPPVGLDENHHQQVINPVSGSARTNVIEPMRSGTHGQPPSPRDSRRASTIEYTIVLDAPRVRVTDGTAAEDSLDEFLESRAHSAEFNVDATEPGQEDGAALDIPSSSPDPSTFQTPPEHLTPARTSPSPAISAPLSNCSSGLSEPDPTDFPIECDYDGPEGHRVLRLKPTADQWADFPSILAFARNHGADEDGCFKVNLPEELQDPLPERDAQREPANAYKPKELKNRFWRVDTFDSQGTFASSCPGADYTTSATQAIEKLRKLFRKSNNKMMRNVRYKVDIPAWTTDQRRAAGVPERSPIHPLKGDKLDHTAAIIPGVHTPYVYESGPHFGASFQIHAEDFRLVSLNHLYKGRKIWIVVPSTAVDVAEKALGRKNKCSQFMRHRAEFLFPQRLEKLGIPFRIVDQRPNETIVILPDAYHEGFSTGYTIAEAKNYADPSWTIDTYQPCEASCELPTAIPDEFMRPLEAGQERLDLCDDFQPIVPESPPRKRPSKRRVDGLEQAPTRETKRARR